MGDVKMFLECVEAFFLVAALALVIPLGFTMLATMVMDLRDEIKERRKRLESERMKRTMSENSSDLTCYNSSVSPDGFLCSKCGWGDFCEPSHVLMSAKYAGDGKGPNFCPNCGRRVAGRDYEA